LTIMAGRLTVTYWNLMYVAAVLCALISIATVYQITVSNDTSNEWIIWICVMLGFSLFGFGFVYEGRYKKEHPEEPLPASQPEAGTQNRLKYRLSKSNRSN